MDTVLSFTFYTQLEDNNIVLKVLDLANGTHQSEVMCQLRMQLDATYNGRKKDINGLDHCQFGTTIVVNLFLLSLSLSLSTYLYFALSLYQSIFLSVSFKTCLLHFNVFY